MDVDPPAPTLSIKTLKSDRERERADRKKNGNNHGKVQKATGKKFDDLLASVFIERKAKNTKGDMAPIYFCLGCDKDFRNPAWSRNKGHFIACTVIISICIIFI